MTKAEVLKALEPFPMDMDVFISERLTEFTYGLVNSVSSQDIKFYEEGSQLYDTKEMEDLEENTEPAIVKCIVFSED